ncbi:hypothetical protein SpiGrapes_0007 [Sphaerochaeta pleomorpha str. Grapes]|uniref:Wadjet protein JetD C-terminal domain-containing protein n=1 Tax=Sphaerochaeta pleomorpha (strain ATCC BAA-1885 / DSM 22778 / Grapes) TaxID=158190 RepID=G8QSH6_SPHPG|nr:DUF3322 domain-containing protein [Sphaerochaeta pleomorpha]AEV27875.1 hypothetical protein SpiGrapes_0007 [Sphaerochaeta pleomorpha str. Grapes]
MISPAEIKTKVENKKNEYLKAKILGTPFFPLSLRADKGSIHDDFQTRESALATLFAQSKAKKGKGYIVETETKESRTMGRQTAVSNLLVETEDDFLYLLGAENKGSLFSANVAMLKATFPEEEFIPWLLAKKSEVFSRWEGTDGQWFCQITRFLVDNPNCGLFARELPAEAPTKFLETNLALVKSLVGSLRPLVEGDDDLTRLGLRKKESLVKIRSNRPFAVNLGSSSCGQTSTIILTPESLRSFNLAAKRIFIVENETMFFTFPLEAEDLCLYVGGYALLACKGSLLFQTVGIYYFGDLDEHGFAILDKFRTLYPQTKSFCMDIKTLEDHCAYLLKGKSYPGEYRNLTPEEKEALHRVQGPEGPLLLEQERISLGYLKNRLQNLTNG